MEYDEPMNNDFDDPFLDDQDLATEGLLSEKDADHILQRGETIRSELKDDFPSNQEQKVQQKSRGKNISMIATIIMVIILVGLCILFAAMYSSI